MADRDDDAGRRKVLELVEGIDYALLTTRAGDGAFLHARPMAWRTVEDDGSLWFFTNRESRKIEELAAEPRVLVTFADPGRQHFVTIAGRADVVDDRGEVETRWSEIYRAWFPGGPKDDGVVMIRVAAEEAEYWDVPTSKMVYAFGYLKAVATGEPARAGEIGAVSMG